MKKIQLSSRTYDKLALVDDEDYIVLMGCRCGVNKRSGYDLYYAQRDICHSIGAGKYHKEHVLMHREIMSMHGHNLDDLVVDHIDHDGLNNQKSNLRIVTQRQNISNTRLMTQQQYGLLDDELIKYGFGSFNLYESPTGIFDVIKQLLSRIDYLEGMMPEQYQIRHIKTGL